MLLFSLGGVVGEELDGHETVARRHCVAVLRDPVSLSYVHLYKHTHASILQQVVQLVHMHIELYIQLWELVLFYNLP